MTEDLLKKCKKATSILVKNIVHYEMLICYYIKVGVVLTILTGVAYVPKLDLKRLAPMGYAVYTQAVCT